MIATLVVLAGTVVILAGIIGWQFSLITALRRDIADRDELIRDLKAAEPSSVPSWKNAVL